jgi:tetratricopeptide (TPR) repeat protein
MDCVSELAAGAPERSRLVELVAVGERALAGASLPVLADDRSDLYGYTIDALHTLARDDEGRRLAGEWAAYLDDQAARASSPAGRAVFDAHRLDAYLTLGEPERAIPALLRSERDFPADYNPPARLAVAYLAARRYREALASVDRALARAYGPRKLRLWATEADIRLAMGDQAGGEAALTRALDFARTIPLTGSYPRQRDAIEQHLERLKAMNK